jgi:uncharacterized membrane protein YfcA
MDFQIAPALGNFSAIALVGLSFLTSALTAALGAGGGLLMLTAMATAMPAAAVIPVHGIVQLGSNGGRALMARRHIARSKVAVLLAGGALGTLLGSLLLLRLPTNWLQLSIAVFVLWMVWLPPSRIGSTSPLGMAGFGAIAGFLGLFVGATGPLVSAYIQRLGLNRHRLIASAAACLSGLNVFKLLVFGMTGFGWREWFILALLMIVSGLCGTWVGLHALGKLPEKVFRPLFRALLSVLALQLAWRGLQGL